MARITINASDEMAAAAKVRATGKFQSVSQYVSQLIAQDLAAHGRQVGLVEEEQAPYEAGPRPVPKKPRGDRT